MRSAGLVAAALLAGCAAAADAPDVQPEHRTSRICRPEATAQFVGRAVSAQLGADVLAATNSEVLRWQPPGTYVTEDWHPWRVTVQYGRDNRVTQVSCG
jgi:opacity protein-like surface antigen